MTHPISNGEWSSHSPVVGVLHVDCVGDVVMLLLLPSRPRSAAAGPPVGGVAVGGVVLLLKNTWLTLRRLASIHAPTTKWRHAICATYSSSSQHTLSDYEFSLLS